MASGNVVLTLVQEARAEPVTTGYHEKTRTKGLAMRSWDVYSTLSAALAQLVRALDCGSRGPPFKPGRWYHYSYPLCIVSRARATGVMALKWQLSGAGRHLCDYRSGCGHRPSQSRTIPDLG
jgi:hypothetical protein